MKEITLKDIQNLYIEKEDVNSIINILNPLLNKIPEYKNYLLGVKKFNYFMKRGGDYKLILTKDNTEIIEIFENYYIDCNEYKKRIKIYKTKLDESINFKYLCKNDFFKLIQLAINYPI